MGFQELLAELPKLSPAERQELLRRLVRIDGDDWLETENPLTDAEKALLDARLAAYAKDSEAGSSWAEVEARIRSRLKA